VYQFHSIYKHSVFGQLVQREQLTLILHEPPPIPISMPPMPPISIPAVLEGIALILVAVPISYATTSQQPTTYHTTPTDPLTMPGIDISIECDIVLYVSGPVVGTKQQ
jgi:hypothetical protein